MNDVCIIGVYFGKFPNYFSLWLKSCSFNKSIDFLVVTDQEIDKQYILPENVRVKLCKLEDLKKIAKEKLKFDISLDRPYKCCDYKVIYGLLFEDELKQYEYWGHCDFDLIWGDLRYFINKYCLKQYDKFLALGHLSLYKNNDEVLFRFKESGGIEDYRTVYSVNKDFAFDETMGITKIYLDHEYPIFKKNVFADISSVYQRFRLIEEYPLDKKPHNYKNQVFYWDNGKVFRDYIKNKKLVQDEFMYIHFKKRPNFVVPFDINETSSFYITYKGFEEKKGETNIELIAKLNPYNISKEFIEKNKYIVQKYAKAILKKIKK